MSAVTSLCYQTIESQNLQTGFLPRFLCHEVSQLSSFFALLLSPCCPIICLLFVGLYRSTHIRASPSSAQNSGLRVFCVSGVRPVSPEDIICGAPVEGVLAFTDDDERDGVF